MRRDDLNLIKKKPSSTGRDENATNEEFNQSNAEK